MYLQLFTSSGTSIDVVDFAPTDPDCENAVTLDASSVTTNETGESSSFSTCTVRAYAGTDADTSTAMTVISFFIGGLSW